MDITPTLVDLCGLDTPEALSFDGRSLRPLLEQGDRAPWPERILMTDRQTRQPIRKWQSTAVMTERWRLIDDRELYDIEADPGQTKNLVDQHPEVVRQLRAFYDKLWHEEIEPELGIVALIPVGTPQYKEVILNYHDCMYRRHGWFQGKFIRHLTMDKVRDRPVGQATAPRTYWPLEVAQAGNYRIELRRWPIEADTPIRGIAAPPRPFAWDSSTHKAKPSAGGKAFPATGATLVIGTQTWHTDVDNTDKAAIFNVQLEAGPVNLSAFFHHDDQELDAFYAHVIKTD